MNNVGLAAHRLVTACPTASPNGPLYPRERHPPGGPGRIFMPRQRPRLPLHPARARLPGAADQAPPHPPLPAPHQRQGRALHPHPTRRLGLRRHLPLLGRARGRPLRPARLPELTQTTRHPRPPTAPATPHGLATREPPGRVVHLADAVRQLFEDPRPRCAVCTSIDPRDVGSVPYPDGGGLNRAHAGVLLADPPTPRRSAL